VQFESGSQRKVNDAVKFDEILYMDRYMLKNKQVSTERRGFVDGLRAQLTKVCHKQSRLFCTLND
jgi:hypothetical protein